jgi:hypothetical protein
MVPNKDYYECPICGRKHSKDNMSWHHLLPSVGGNERQEPRIYICKTCHAVIHDCHSNKDLRENYNSLDRILASEAIQRLVNVYKYKSDDCVFKLKKIKESLCQPKKKIKK